MFRRTTALSCEQNNRPKRWADVPFHTWRCRVHRCRRLERFARLRLPRYVAVNAMAARFGCREPRYLQQRALKSHGRLLLAKRGTFKWANYGPGFVSWFYYVTKSQYASRFIIFFFFFFLRFHGSLLLTAVLYSSHIVPLFALLHRRRDIGTDS